MSYPISDPEDVRKAQEKVAEQQAIGIEELIAGLIEKRPQFQIHEHQWAVMAVDYPPEPARTPVHPRLSPSPAFPVTFVAIQCSGCGIPQAVVMEGHWTMDQLMLKIGESVATKTRSTPGTPGSLS